MKKSQLFLVLHLIGWEDGASFRDQSKLRRTRAIPDYFGHSIENDPIGVKFDWVGFDSKLVWFFFRFYPLKSQLKISAAECNDLKFCLCFSAAEGEVMKEFYNENGKHKDTKYYYGKTSESKWIKKRGDLIIVNMWTWLFVCLVCLSQLLTVWSQSWKRPKGAIYWKKLKNQP